VLRALLALVALLQSATALENKSEHSIVPSTAPAHAHAEAHGCTCTHDVSSRLVTTSLHQCTAARAHRREVLRMQMEAVAVSSNLRAS
jgi:hypothetical protein